MDVCLLFLVDQIACCGVHGGIYDDLLVARFGFPGRIWARILCFFFEGFFLFGLGRADNSEHWSVALIMLIELSIWKTQRVKSAKTSWSVPQPVTDEDEIRVTAAGGVSPYIAYAARAFNEMSKSELVFRGTSNVLSKVVTAVK